MVFLDTNVLLTATAPARVLHRQALAVFDEWPARVRLCTSGQVLREYLVVATRPTSSNGLGLERADALANVRAFRERMFFLEEDRAVHELLFALLERVDCRGKRIHDAAVVATALRHEVSGLLTENIGDFRPFAGRIDILELGGAGP